MIGVPDDRSGEAVKLFVVPRDATLTSEELKAYCKENFTGYKIPKHIVLRESLPMTPVGKILRRSCGISPDRAAIAHQLSTPEKGVSRSRRFFAW